MKKAPSSLEYVLVHELVHLLERSHGERFLTLMDALMPAWRERRHQLAALPLHHAEWGC